MYLGPYLSAKVEVIKEKVDSCEDHAHAWKNEACPEDRVSLYLENAFCSVCGVKRVERFKTIEVEKPEDIDEFWRDHYTKGDFRNYLSDTSWMSPPPIFKEGDKEFRLYRYTPNRHWDELSIPDIDGDSEVALDLESINVEERKAKFIELFKDEIEYLKQWHEVKIHFGLLVYFS